jgi:hypothetical protein
MGCYVYTRQYIFSTCTITVTSSYLFELLQLVPQIDQNAEQQRNLSTAFNTRHNSHNNCGATAQLGLDRLILELLDSRKNKHERRTSMSPAGFEPAIPATGRQHTYAIECTAKGSGLQKLFVTQNN